MERVSNRHIEDFPSVTLYIDDIEEIVALFASACEHVEIETGEFKTSDPSELTDMASKFRSGRFPRVKISGHVPYVSLELLPQRARAYISEDSVEQRGVISKARDVLNRRKKLKPGLVSGFFVFVLSTVGFNLIEDRQFTIGFILLGFAFLCWPVIVNLSMKNTVTVNTSRLSDRSHFFSRKRDDLILAMISAIVGGAIAIVVAKLTK